MERRRRRASAVCIHQQKILLVKLRDPVNGRTYYFPPGGKIEAGEMPWAAAERETWEETGYRVSVEQNEFRLAEYPFIWGGRTVTCLTSFYRANLASAPAEEPTDTEDLVSVDWIDVDQLAAVLEYSAPLKAAVMALLS